MSIIKSLETGSPAEAAGLRACDTIVEINGKPTYGKSNNAVGQMILNSSSPINLLISRKPSSQTASPHVSRREAYEAAREPEDYSITESRITMSSSRLQGVPTEVPKVRVHNSSAPGDPTLMSSGSVAAISQTSINRRSLSSFTLPRDAPIPRLCRVRALEESMGFTVSGSSNRRGEFRVNDVAPNSPAAHIIKMMTTSLKSPAKMLIQ